MRNESLRAFVRSHAEDRPGVYRWLGGDGRILYVGKSVRVKTRLLSYFTAAEPKASRMVRDADDVAWDYVPNEFGALVREMRLIQTWRPEYNVQHKRKRRYAFIKVTREVAPRILPVTRIALDGAGYYGPFGRVRWVVEAVKDLARVMGLRDCPGDTPVHFGDQLEIFTGGRPPRCMRADTGTCLTPCAGRCTAAEYAERVDLTRAFLEGRGTAPLDFLSADLAHAADRLDFEYAARLRDKRETLGKLQEYLASFRGQIDNLSFVYRVPGFRGNDRLYLIHRGRIRADLPLPKSDGQRLQVSQEVRQAFRPSLGQHAGIHGGDGAAEALLLVRWFNRNPGELRRTMTAEKWLAQRGRR